MSTTPAQHGTSEQFVASSNPSNGGATPAEGVPPSAASPEVKGPASSAAAALQALRAATGSELKGAISAVFDLTEGSIPDCENIVAAQGKAVIANVLASSTDINIHVTGLSVMRNLAAVEEPKQQEDPLPTGTEANARRCEAQIDGGKRKSWETLTFVVRNGDIFVFQHPII